MNKEPACRRSLKPLKLAHPESYMNIKISSVELIYDDQGTRTRDEDAATAASMPGTT
jgi:hypothetical protein